MGIEQFLQGRVAMVTGGTSGIGHATAFALADAGANVAIGSRSANISSSHIELEARGIQSFAMDLDVGNTESVQTFHDAVVKALGPIDILVNAAGITYLHPLCDHPDEHWHRVLNINLNGIYRTVKLCLPGMIARKWGRIINIASTAATVGEPNVVAYCTSKSAILGLTRCVALEGAPHGVSCNAISLGWVETELGKRAMEDFATVEDCSLSAYVEEVKQQNPQKRIIQPREIAALAIFLCRNESLGITMQDLTVAAGSLW